MLVRRVGPRHLELVEDAVQSALMAALTSWQAEAPTGDPAAWLHRVAQNRLIQDLRQTSGRLKILERVATDLADPPSDVVEPALSREIRDGMLRMLFVCCDPELAWESQIVLSLKTLCGFSTSEIAARLFITQANVHKRLGRARDRLREKWPDAELPVVERLEPRLQAVHGVLYLLFNEGYLSLHAEHAIRRELCDEAVRLTTLLAEHPTGATPETFALLALMHLHLSRLGSRDDGNGGLLLLEEQDRAQWDRGGIDVGLQWLAKSASGDVFSRFHAEAAIAAQHCLAATFADTCWSEIASLYATLERVAPSPIHTLNRAVAVAAWQGAPAGLAVLHGQVPPAWLAGAYVWDAVLADLHRRAGHSDAALQHRERALTGAPSAAVRSLLERRLAAC